MRWVINQGESDSVKLWTVNMKRIRLRQNSGQPAVVAWIVESGTNFPRVEGANQEQRTRYLNQ